MVFRYDSVECVWEGSISIRLVVRRDSVRVWCGVRVNSVLDGIWVVWLCPRWEEWLGVAISLFGKWVISSWWGFTMFGEGWSFLLVIRCDSDLGGGSLRSR